MPNVNSIYVLCFQVISFRTGTQGVVFQNEKILSSFVGIGSCALFDVPRFSLDNQVTGSILNMSDA